MRRRHVEDVGPVDAPPELTGACVVEDWVSVDERPPAWWSLDRPGDLESWWKLTARRRQRDAQRAWAEARGCTTREAVTMFAGCGGVPRFRDWMTFTQRRR